MYETKRLSLGEGGHFPPIDSHLYYKFKRHMAPSTKRKSLGLISTRIPRYSLIYLINTPPPPPQGQY